MSQTTLNLVAISIFLVTFSTLAGPLFNLSPTIPAIATFTLLGLATVDSFGLQGKGGAVVSDLFAWTSRQNRDRILHHEAGHFLVAHFLDIPVTGYTLSAWEALKQKQPGLGGVTFADDELASNLQQGTLKAQLLDRYCTIWMAGITAENLVYNDAHGGADDLNKLKKVLTPIGFSAAAQAQKQRSSAISAKTILTENWKAYEALVQAMQQRVSVDECRIIIARNPPPLN
ncbi:hypothetical protein [Synechocystis sp. PCC 7509]|uniref:hypothetical protein n=1 Tax=Synechocystis sp. PCC 7509 TaxID=927677 RepID=UPI0002AB9CAE|nr:hypothetical protein [Synechocystis sp. PCC 7509]